MNTHTKFTSLTRSRLSLLTVISLLLLSLSWTDSPMVLVPVAADDLGVLAPEWSGNPPNGRTGAPGDGLCSDCHTQASPPQDGSVNISGMPTSIIPNTLYTLTVTVDNPNSLASLGGFQMVVLNSGNTNAGSLDNPSSSSTVTPSGGRTYHEHNPAMSFGAGTEVTYSVDWTAPAGPDMELITAYAAGNVANGNGNNSGDLIVTTTSSGTMSGAALEVEVQATDALCFGNTNGAATAVVTGGTPGYTYSWNNGASTETINNLTAGTYCVTVTDNTGSTAEACADVLEPTAVVASLVSAVDPSCQGSFEGSITVSASGGTGGYSYLWSNGANSASNFGLSEGEYMVTVTDDSGCTDALSVTLADPDAITIELVDLTNPPCFGESSGSIVVSAMGGTGTITYAWSTGDTGSTLSDVPAGTYIVTAEDENGCSAEEIYVLIDPEPLDLQLELLVDVSCNGASDGSITVSLSGSNPTYEWSNGAIGAQNDNLFAGTYSVTATDNSGCSVESVYAVSEPDAMQITISGSASLPCFGDTTGALTVVVSGGQSPYSFTWSNGATTNAVSGLPAGIYSIIVTDQNGCSGTGQFEITEPDELMANVSSTDETSAGAADGTATSNPTGGTPPYTYLWSNATTTSMIVGLIPGVYNVTVTDSNGCTAVQSTTINAFGCSLIANVTAIDISCNGIADGSADVAFSGAIGSVAFLWSNGAITQSISDLGPGTYSVTVTDSAGCVAADVAFINQPQPLSTECTVLHESGPDANDGFVVCMVSGGIPPYVMPGEMITDNTFHLSGLAPGVYELLISDANGCLFTEEITINAFGCPMIDNVDVLDVLCHGEISGSAMVEFSGGQSMVTVDWSNGFTGNPATMLAAGNYSVTISDTSGCMSTVDFVVAEPDAVSLVVDTIINESSAGNDGAIQISIAGGTLPYTIDWMLNGNTISTEQNPDGLTMGNYVVVVTDANGCSLQSDTILVEGTTAVEAVDSKMSISVFPNPVADIATLIWKSDVVMHRVEIWTVQGTRVVEFNLDNHSTGQLSFDTGIFSQGLYYIIATGSEGKGVIKLIKI